MLRPFRPLSLLRSGVAGLAVLGAAAGAQAQEVVPTLDRLNSAMRAFIYGEFARAPDVVAALNNARDRARAESEPIPPEMRAELEPFFDAELLDRVRYRVGDTRPLTIAGFTIPNSETAAITLIDTIVFRTSELTENAALWAHELHHVEQFRDWGVDGFIVRYAQRSPQVELDAEERAAEYLKWREGRGG
jgi:hypothetical protein